MNSATNNLIDFENFSSSKEKNSKKKMIDSLLENNHPEIKMPKLIKYTLDINNQLNSINKDDDEEFNLLNSIVHYIEVNAFKWVNPADENFQFTLPESLFNEMTVVHYTGNQGLNTDVRYYNEETTLNSEQFEEIYQKGQFSIKSHNEEVPYVWQLSNWVVKGYQNIKKSFIDNMGHSLFFLYALKYRFSSEQETSFYLSFKSSFYFLFDGIWRILDLLIGLPNRTLINREAIIECRMWSENKLNLIQKLPRDVLTLFCTDDLNLISSLNSQFQLYWTDEKIRYDQELYDQNFTSDEILTKVREHHDNCLIEFINNTEILPSNKKVFLSEFYLASFLINKHKFENSQKINEKGNEMRKKISQDYPIRSKISDWFDNELYSQTKPFVEEYNNIMENNIQYDISKYEIPYLIWRNNLDAQKSIPKLAKIESDNSPNEYTYDYAKELTRYCFPPYRAYRNENGRYSLEKEKTTHIESKWVFWRIWLTILRYFYTTFNIIFFFLLTSIHSPFGLKSLFYKTIYMNRQILEDGTIVETDQTFTFLSTMSNLFKWISISREDFENQPDTGLFGKKFARLFNLFSNYVFKLIFLGSIILIGFPTLIILYFCFAIFIVLTSWIIAFIWIIVYNFIKIIFYDWETEYYNCRVFPLITYLFGFILTFGIFQFILTLLAIFIQPVISLLIFIFAILRFLFRVLYDNIMFLFTKCLAKIPQTDSGIAWKISGPNMAQKSYNHIPLQDSIVMLQAQMEKEKLENFKSIVYAKLNYPAKVCQEKITNLFSKVNMTFNYSDEFTHHYKNILDQQIKRQNNFFPHATDVKYSYGELEILKNLGRECIKDYVLSNNMDYIWSKYSLQKDSWARLCDAILTTTFGEQIHFSLEETDKFMEMQRTSNSHVQAMMEKLLSNPRYNDISLVRIDRRVSKLQLPEICDLNCIKSNFDLGLSQLTFQQKIQFLGSRFAI